MNDRTELRRLLEAASPVPWSTPRPSRSYAPYKVMDGRGYDRSYDLAYTVEDTLGDNAEFIVAAVNALPGLLDQLDAAEAALARVRELHERESFWQYHRDQEHSYLTQQDAADESGCDCPYAPEPSADLDHTPECLATISHFDVCSECARIEYADADRQAHGEFSGYAEALWPCPTIRALGGES